MNNNMKLTEIQVRKLLKNAYGFIDKHGMLFRLLSTQHNFLLQGPDYDSVLEFSHDNASFENGTVTFETPDGDTETFTVLILAAMLIDKVRGSSNITMRLFET